MAKQVFSVDVDGEQKKLEIHWKRFYKNFTILIDEIKVGSLEGSKELQSGREFLYKDNKLKVQLVRNFITPEIQILWNGGPVLGSVTDPITRINTGLGVVVFLIVINLLMGGVAFFGDIPFLKNLGYGIYNLGIALIFIFSFCIGKFYSPSIGLLCALLVFSGDAVMAAKQMVDLNLQPGGGWIIVRFVIITPLFLGCKAAFYQKKVSALGSHEDL